MYLREMGSVKLLSRESEIAIAKRDFERDRNELDAPRLAPARPRVARSRRRRGRARSGRSPDWLKTKNPPCAGGDARGGRGLETR
jgi:hypothetical protein